MEQELEQLRHDYDKKLVTRHRVREEASLVSLPRLSHSPVPYEKGGCEGPRLYYIALIAVANITSIQYHIRPARLLPYVHVAVALSPDSLIFSMRAQVPESEMQVANNLVCCGGCNFMVDTD